MITFLNARLVRQEYHRMVLAVLRWEGAQWNRTYQLRRKFWPIKLYIVRPQTEGDTAFETLKEEIDRTQWPTTARAPWISQETWRLADRRTALLIT